MEIEEKVGRGKLQVGMSLLQLPVSRAKDEEKANYTVSLLLSLTPYHIFCETLITHPHFSHYLPLHL